MFQKSRWDTGNVLLGTQQQWPQVPHELPSILPIQEARQVDLHHLAIWVLFLELVKYELYDDVILEPQNLCHALGNPRFDDFQVHFGHVHLLVQTFCEFQLLQQFLVLVAETIVLLRTCAAEESRVHYRRK